MQEVLAGGIRVFQLQAREHRLRGITAGSGQKGMRAAMFEDKTDICVHARIGTPICWKLPARVPGDLFRKSIMFHSREQNIIPNCARFCTRSFRETGRPRRRIDVNSGN